MLITAPMGNKVIASLENSYGDHCVDLFAREEDAVARAKATVSWLKSHE